MIKFEYTEVVGWEHAIRGMRNPLNSWDRSDSAWNECSTNCAVWDKCQIGFKCPIGEIEDWPFFCLGKADLDLMKRLRNGGADDRKFMRMLIVYVDITAPLYWWKEFDTYKVGTVANSCSTMHKIQAKEFTMDDFSTEHMDKFSIHTLEKVINLMETNRMFYQTEKKKDSWWQMIQLLPTCFNQKRTVMLNYEVLVNMYKSRKAHKLDEWRDLCAWIEKLPYSELITG